MKNTKIVVDTSVWVDFFRNPESEITGHLNTLLRDRRVVMVGMVLAEILQGIRDARDEKRVKMSMDKLPYFEMTREVWQTAGEISASLRKKGVTIPLSDLVVAACALSGDFSVFTTDPHFKSIPGLNLHPII